MKEGYIYKAIKSDIGILITIITFVGGILWNFYSVKTDIAVLNTEVIEFNNRVNGVDSHDGVQDTEIGQNTADIAKVQGEIKFSIREADTTNSVINE